MKSTAIAGFLCRKIGVENIGFSIFTKASWLDERIERRTNGSNDGQTNLKPFYSGIP